MAERDFNDLETPLRALREQVARIEAYARANNLPEPKELAGYRDQLARLEKRVYSRLNAWDKTLIARHPQRPYSLDYIRIMFDDFVELHGDRYSGDDGALVTGLGRFNGIPVATIAQQKGRDVRERKLRNFGMARPEGYNKAMRLMDLADRFHLPVVTFVDTPAADPGVAAEEHGISWKIAESMRRMFALTVPAVSVVIGEGGSGGAIAVACANKVLMLEYAVYSVIPPEGCAAILWRDPTRKADASAALRLTAADALEFGLVDEVIPEPPGAAHTYPVQVAASLKTALRDALTSLNAMKSEDLIAQRRERFARLGVFATAES